MNAVSRYFDDLTSQFGRGWNAFWFRPASVLPVCLLRIAAGLAAFYFVASYTTDLVRWFGPQGLLPTETVRQLTGAVPGQPLVFRFSYLHLPETPTGLYVLHALGLVIIALFTAGVFSRLTNILSLVVVLAYVHRAPMITGQFEPVLTMLLFYLCFAPTGSCWSLDRRLSTSSPGGLRRWAQALIWADDARQARSFGAAIGLRLIQVHTALLYFVMALDKLAGETWWNGEAIWWLIARSESRLVDLTFLHDQPLLLNAWTHAVVLFELVFALLVWNRLARPLLLVLAFVHWTLLALVTGLVSFSCIMLIANLAFLPPSFLSDRSDEPGETL